MNHTHDVLRERLLGAVLGSKPKPLWTMENLSAQWSDDFENKMRVRLMMGAMRYGNPKIVGLPKTHTGQDSMGSVQKRLVKYAQDGNTEHLVDIANLCMVEYEMQPRQNFNATDEHDMRVQ